MSSVIKRLKWKFNCLGEISLLPGKDDAAKEHHGRSFWEEEGGGAFDDNIMLLIMQCDDGRHSFPLAPIVQENRTVVEINCNAIFGACVQGNRGTWQKDLKNRLSPITINPVAISSGDNKTLNLSAKVVVLAPLPSCH